MSTSQTASASGKTAKGATPFDAILKAESEQNERVAAELAAMEEEEKELRQSLAKKEGEAEEELKTAAMEELKEYKGDEPAKILDQAEKEAESLCQKLEESYPQRAEQRVQDLVTLAVSDDSPVLR